MSQPPLHEKLYRQIRIQIETGQLEAGSRMPSTRSLSDQLTISRTTVLEAYGRLIAEGWLETRPAVGTFVAHRSAEPVRVPANQGGMNSRNIVEESEIGAPDPSLFPASRWRLLLRRAADRLTHQRSARGAANEAALRNAIASWLSISRGLTADPEQIVLVNSRQQALHIAAHLVLAPGRRVATECPCDVGAAAAAFTSAGAKLLAVPVDSNGIRPDQLPESNTTLLYVTLERQHPHGVGLAGARRAVLLDWVARTGTAVLEDDCLGDLHPGGIAEPCLMNLDQSESVMMIGGFHISLGPWISLGYLIVPRRLIAAAHTARRWIDNGSRWLEAAALTEFLASGDYARHVHRVRKVYQARRDALITGLRRHFGTTADVNGAGPGLSIAWRLRPQMASAAVLADAARRCGLEASAVASTTTEVVLLGFGNLAEQRVESHIAQLAARCLSGMMESV